MKAPRRSARSPYSPSLIEQLEARQLLAVGLTNGVLNVIGSSRADTITVRASGNQIVVRMNAGNSRTFTRSAVDQLVVKGGGGNDTIGVAGAFNSAVISGGNGNDRINGSGGGDLIGGGAGNDFVSGRGGADQIYGDAGDDELHGGAGNDTLGGDDEDRLWARSGSRPADIEGDDQLFGEAGDDWLLSGIQSDFIVDRSGADQFAGGSGNDVLDTRGKVNDDDLETGFEDGDVLTNREPGDWVPVEDVTGPIPNGEDDYSHHKHAFIKIFLEAANGARTLLEIPSFAGEFGAQPVVHNHENPAPLDVRGFLLHFHNTDSSGGAGRVLTLGDFFEHFGISFSSQNIGRFRVDANHTLSMTVQVRGAGAFITPAQNFNNYAIATNDADFADSTKYDQIVIVYKTLP